MIVMRLTGAASLILLLGACAPKANSPAMTAPDRARLQDEALGVLKRAAAFPENPVVRVAAIEALQEVETEEVAPWIRSGLFDAAPAVRFAACAAVGVRRDRLAYDRLVELTQDEDESVRAAAMFGLHMLGDSSRTGSLATLLLEHPDALVRRNAALLLGLTGEEGAVKVLARAMKDRDEGVRLQALEAMARLGNHEARRELAFTTNAGVGSDETFAVTALANMRDKTNQDALRYKLATAPHQETRLAAARGLGMLKIPDGYDTARSALNSPQRGPRNPKDPPRAQALRVRMLAAGSLGAIGNPAAIPPLRNILRDSGDPRLQVAAARAILEILRTDRRRALPFQRR